MNGSLVVESLHGAACGQLVLLVEHAEGDSIGVSGSAGNKSTHRSDPQPQLFSRKEPVEIVRRMEGSIAPFWPKVAHLFIEAGADFIILLPADQTAGTATLGVVQKILTSRDLVRQLACPGMLISSPLLVQVQHKRDQGPGTGRSPAPELVRSMAAVYMS
jgi:hypothetical protein